MAAGGVMAIDPDRMDSQIMRAMLAVLLARLGGSARISAEELAAVLEDMRDGRLLLIRVDDPDGALYRIYRRPGGVP